jgi:hypothetical protein
MLLILAGLAGLALPLAQGLARPRPPVYQPPPPPPPAGPVGLPDRMIQEAAEFDSYMRGVTGISPAFSGADSVSQALAKARAYGPRGLVRGAVVYAAIAALEEHSFVAALRTAGNTPEHRQQMVGYILANPAYVYAFDGSQAAAGLARGALGPSSLDLYRLGKSVRQASYDVQHQGWSKSEVADLKGRLAASEAAADAEMAADPERLAEARRSAGGAAGALSAAVLAPPYTPMVSRALALAAIAALGEARDEDYDRLSVLTVDDDASACLGAAKRNFHQCLAVAKPNYEDIFCTGQHAMIDTGACMAKAVGVELPVEPPPPPPPVKKSPPRRHRRH